MLFDLMCPPALAGYASVPRKQETFSHLQEPTMSAKKAEPTNDPILAEFRETMYKLYYPEGLSEQNHLDTLSRPIVCTPIKANNETISQWVISVNGSPPKGTLVIDGKGHASDPVFLLRMNFKRVGATNATLVCARREVGISHHYATDDKDEGQATGSDCNPCRK
jgi:hypothetical protein